MFAYTQYKTTSEPFNILALSLKGEFAIFFIGQSDVSKYDDIWSENGDVIDRFIHEILMFKCVRHALNQKRPFLVLLSTKNKNFQ